MAHFPTEPLLTAISERLTGADGEGLGLAEDVYTAGSVPTNASAPYVVVEIPRPNGSETIDGKEKWLVRHNIRVHTRYPQGRADRSEALSIADSVHEALEGAEISVPGFRSSLYVPEPNQRPQTYDVADKKAYDVILRYRNYRL